MPTPTRTRASAAALREPATVSSPAPSTSYSDNMTAFRRAYRRARRRKANGEDPLADYVAMNSVANYGDEPIVFGIELEFGGYVNADDLAIEFHDRGWTPTPYQEGYHARASQTSRNLQGGWRFEEDGSVSGGEMITPILRDTAETWNAISNVLDTIRDHGGTPARAAGSHIHVDTTVIQENHAAFQRLIRMFLVFEDVLYRLAADPHNDGGHRGISYCHTTPTHSSDSDSLPTLVRNHSSRGALNLSAVRTNGIGHAEMRLWDSSLNLAVIQTQVKLSIALMAAAANPATDSVLNDLEAESLGSHYRARREADENNRGRVNLRGDEWAEDTRRFRIMLDLLFTSSRDKEQVTTLFAMNKWTRIRRSRW